MQSPAAASSERRPFEADADEDVPNGSTASAPGAATPDAQDLRTAAALEVAALDGGDNFGPATAFEMAEAVMREAMRPSQRYGQVLGGVRRHDDPAAREHQASYTPPVLCPGVHTVSLCVGNLRPLINDGDLKI